MNISLRAVVSELKISGAAKAVSIKDDSLQVSGQNEKRIIDSEELEAEMNDLLDEMGLGSDDDEEDDVDLR